MNEQMRIRSEDITLTAVAQVVAAVTLCLVSSAWRWSCPASLRTRTPRATWDSSCRSTSPTRPSNATPGWLGSGALLRTRSPSSPSSLENPSRSELHLYGLCWCSCVSLTAQYMWCRFHFRIVHKNVLFLIILIIFGYFFMHTDYWLFDCLIRNWCSSSVSCHYNNVW